MVERLVYTEKVSGSNPLLPKSKKLLKVICKACPLFSNRGLSFNE
jgi:hypothetical protein